MRRGKLGHRLMSCIWRAWRSAAGVLGTVLAVSCQPVRATALSSGNLPSSEDGRPAAGASATASEAEATDRAAAKRNADQEARRQTVVEEAETANEQECIKMCRTRCASSIRFLDCFRGCIGMDCP